MSHEFSKTLSAVLLTLAVVGGAAVYLSSTLVAKPVQYAGIGIVTEQPVQAKAKQALVITDAERAS